MKTPPKDIRQIVAQQLSYYGTLYDKLQSIEKDKELILDQMRTVLDKLDAIEKIYPSLDLPILELPKELQFPLGANTKIGDAIEMILRKKGALPRPALLRFLQVGGIPLSPTAPHTVVWNAIERDKQKRFKILKDGRVALRKENEKADAKS